MSDMQSAMQAAAQRKSATKMKFKGKYAGPDKFKGKIPEGYKGKAKGKYFGKDSRKGSNVEATKPSYDNALKTHPAMPSPSSPMPTGYDEWQKRKDEATESGKSYIDGWRTEGTQGKTSAGIRKSAVRPDIVEKFKKLRESGATPSSANTSALADAVKSQAG